MTRPSSARHAVLLLAAVVIGLAPGCSSAPKPSETGDQSLSATDEQIFIGDSIEKNYDPNVIIKRAEAFFEKEEYSEAIIEYQHFLDLHRVHTLAPYAQFRLGESHFKMIRTIDRDTEPVAKALATYERLLKDFPGSQWDAEAQERIKACQNFLAQNSLFIGQFYYRREAFLAAAHRFETIVKEYPDLDVAEDSLYYLALSYNELGLDDWARDNLLALDQRFPNNKYQSESRKLLAKLNGKPPSETAAVPSDVQQNGASNGSSGVSATRRPQATAASASAPLPTFR